MVADLLWLVLGGGFITAKLGKEKAQISRTNKNPNWFTTKNYNLERQRYYESMFYHDKQQMAKLLDAPIKEYGVLPRKAVTELLKKEGIDYHDIHEASEEWCRASGYKKDQYGNWKKPWWKL